MKVAVSWMRDFVDVPDDPPAVAARIAARGFEVASVDGDVIDFEITANRPDCLSVIGLAREAAVAFNLPLRTGPGARTSEPATSAAAPAARREDSESGSISALGAPPPSARAAALEDSLSSRGAQPLAAGIPRVPVTIDHPSCGRYVLATADVVVRPSPAWLSGRLIAAGLRPINNIVDVTNYVMLEMGHPMHAFDASKLEGPEIRVRLATAGEKITTLDGHTRTLDAATLVIADRHRAVAIAGVMGGATSEVSAVTTRIALESAWFEPASVRVASRRMGLKTDASARFERGADIDAAPAAVARALSLLAQIDAGHNPGTIVDLYPRPASPVTIGLRRGRLARLLGDSVPDPETERILTGLGFSVIPTGEGWQVSVPARRVDVRREADLVEEVGRHWGFDRIPATFPTLRAVPRPTAPGVIRGRMVRRLLTASGLQEAVTFTFIEESAAAPFCDHPRSAVAIANPLSEKFAVLRPSLLPGLVDALVYNRRRETEDVRLFEAGAIFSSTGERQAVGWVMTGERDRHWSGDAASLDFFDAKGLAEILASAFGTALTAELAEDVPGFVRGRAARLSALTPDALIVAGIVGELRPDVLSARGLPQGEAVYAGELDLAALTRLGAHARTAIDPLPRHPSIVRDLSVIIDDRLPAEQVRGTIRAVAPATLVAVREFDRYQGQGVPAGRVSLSLRLTFRGGDRTLTDQEVQQAIDAVVTALAREHQATLRGKSQ